MSRPLLVVDTETTGLDPERHEIWDLAVIGISADGTRSEHQWYLKPDLTAADPAALQVGRYYERTASLVPVRHHDPAAASGNWWSSRADVAAVIAPMLAGATILGAVPSFDAGFLTAFLRKHGHAPAWHYRLQDFGSMAYGWLHGREGALFAKPDRGVLPAIGASTDEFALALGLDLGRYERHSALGDCRIVADGLDVMCGRTL